MFFTPAVTSAVQREKLADYAVPDLVNLELCGSWKEKYEVQLKAAAGLWCSGYIYWTCDKTGGHF